MDKTDQKERLSGAGTGFSSEGYIPTMEAVIAEEKKVYRGLYVSTIVYGIGAIILIVFFIKNFWGMGGYGQFIRQDWESDKMLCAKEFVGIGILFFLIVYFILRFSRYVHLTIKSMRRKYVLELVVYSDRVWWDRQEKIYTKMQTCLSEDVVLGVAGNGDEESGRNNLTGQNDHSHAEEEKKETKEGEENEVKQEDKKEEIKKKAEQCIGCNKVKEGEKGMDLNKWLEQVLERKTNLDSFVKEQISSMNKVMGK